MSIAGMCCNWGKACLLHATLSFDVSFAPSAASQMPTSHALLVTLPWIGICRLLNIHILRTSGLPLLGPAVVHKGRSLIA